MVDKLTASEALYGFCAWLTGRKEETIMSEHSDCGEIAVLINRFCEENNLESPRLEWYNDLIIPSGKCSGPAVMKFWRIK